MQSLPISANVSIFLSPKFIKRQSSQSVFIKKRGNFQISLLSTSEGFRIFVSGLSFHQESNVLYQMFKWTVGLNLGYRKRLRLVGIGFRGTKQEAIVSQSLISKGPLKNVIFPKYRLRDNTIFDRSPTKKSFLFLKLGYSHSVAYPLDVPFDNSLKIDVSRLESRTKGTVILVEGSNPISVSSTASRIRAFRYPDIYKGKGIHLFGESITLKKGKRQN